MNFIDHAKVLIPALIKLPITVYEGNLNTLDAFESKFCFLPELQTLYTAKGLLAFFSKKDGKQIYILSDALETQAVIFKASEKWIILGPYVNELWQDNAAKALLVNCGTQESFFLPYKIYRCSLTLFEQTFILNIAMLLLENIEKRKLDHKFEFIDNEANKVTAINIHIANMHQEIDVVNVRYMKEIQLIEVISQGDAVKALQLFDGFEDDATIYHFALDKDKDWEAGAAITRTWGRLAAVKAGLPPIIIDSISQEYAQKMHFAVGRRKLMDLQRKFIIDICNAIRKCNRRNYSPHVKRAVEYIDMHFSQEITVYTICEINQLSRKHFVKLFSQETGKTVKQYLMQVRCERAAELLENSQLLIQDISHYVGYEDNNYFSKIFKSVMGMTPQEYRKSKTFYNSSISSK